jgi:hypothetical protein
MEDPRAFYLSGSLLYVCTSLLTWGDSGWKTRVAILSANDGSNQILDYSGSKSIEKNWLPTCNITESSEFIYSSKPFVIVRFDKAFSVIEERSLSDHNLNYHGGTVPIILPGGFHLRIARRRLRLWPYGLVHVNYAILYDKDFGLLFESRPFLFSGLGFEVCNGAWLEHGELILSWSEDDENLLIGKVQLNSFFHWLFTYHKPPYFLRLTRDIKTLFLGRKPYHKITVTNYSPAR